MTLKEKMLDLLNTRKTLLEKGSALVLDGKMDEHEANLAEVKALNTQIEGLQAMIAEEEKDFHPPEPDLHGQLGGSGEKGGGAAEGGKPDSVKAFAAAARSGFAVAKDLNEGGGEDGGYTVPEDIVTRVETLRDATASLRALVGVESVTTNKGRRTYKKRAQQTGFAKVAESGRIGKKDSPQFTVLNYAVAKYAGFLPVTSELLEDSDENITGTLVEWIAGEARVTDNTLILAAIKKKPAVDLKDLDGIKKALIVTLGSAFLATSKIVTNDDGLFWLSTRKDANGRDLLTPIPSDPAHMQLSVGANVVPVAVFPNGDLASDGSKVPFILGDLMEGIRVFDRKTLTVTSSDIAVAGDFNAFEQDMTLWKAVERLDVQQRDEKAYLYGFIDTTAPVEPTGGEGA